MSVKYLGASIYDASFQLIMAWIIITELKHLDFWHILLIFMSCEVRLHLFRTLPLCFRDDQCNEYGTAKGHSCVEEIHAIVVDKVDDVGGKLCHPGMDLLLK